MAQSDTGNPVPTGNNFIFFISQAMETFVRDKVFGELPGILRMPFTIGVTLWVLLVGYQHFLPGQIVYGTMVQTMILIVIAGIFVLGSGGGLVFEWIYSPLNRMFMGLASWFMSAAAIGQNVEGVTDSVAILERQIAGLWGFIDTIADKGGDGFAEKIKVWFLGLMLYITYGILWLCYVFFFAYSIFAVHVLYAITPIVVLLLPFSKTRPTFIAWFRGVINYLTLPVFAAIAIGLTLAMMDQAFAMMTLAMTSGTDGFPKEVYLYLMFGGWLSILIIIRTPDMAAFITGGISSGLGGTALQLVNTAANVATLGKLSGRGGGGGAVGGVSNRSKNWGGNNSNRITDAEGNREGDTGGSDDE